MKGQIALDYLIIFNFIIFIFLIIFVVVAYQRGQTINQETFSQIQIIAQTVAAQISAASLAGNGYAAHLLLPTSISIVKYNLSITSAGLVIASVNTNGQIVQATAYSLVKRIVSNSAFAPAGNPLLYVLPTANGSLALQNSLGNICVDYQCPPPVNQTQVFTLSSAVTHAAEFNGANTFLYAPTPQNIKYNNFVTLCLWFNTANILTGEAPFGQVGNGHVMDMFLLPARSVVGSGAYTHLSWNISTSDKLQSRANIYPNRWYFACGEYGTLGANQQQSLYINGVLDSNTIVPSFDNAIGSQSVAIGAYGTAFGTAPPLSPFNGTIADVQLYTSALSQPAISSLFAKGITSAPADPSHTAGLWPLDGTANDTSANGNPMVSYGPLLYVSVAQLYATTQNASGSPISHSLVGFTASQGNFTSGPVAANYTDGTGTASTILNQLHESGGYATVTATGFQGNSSIAGNLIAWYPFNTGQGNTTYDLSGNGNNGNMYYVSWSKPNYVASFNGRPGYGELSNSVKFNSAQSLTVTAWVNQSSFSSTGPCQDVVADNGYGGYAFVLRLPGGTDPQCAAATGVTAMITLDNGGSWTTCASNEKVSLGQWSFLALAYGKDNSGLAKGFNVYINGVNVCSVNQNTPLVPAGSITIGSSNQIAPDYFNGSISNVQLYNYALRATDISSLYAKGLAGTPLATSGLIGWWPLDGDAYDYSGNGNTGSLLGQAAYARLSIQPANNTYQIFASFNGISSNIVGSNIIIYPISNFEWVYPTAYPSSFAQIAAFKIEGDGGNFGVGISSSGNVVVSSDDATATSALQLPLNQWSLVGFSSMSTQVAAYANGQSQTFTTPPQITGADDNAFSIGARYGGGGSSSFFTGNIANVQIYSNFINASGASTLFSEGVAGVPLRNSGLAGWYPLAASVAEMSGLAPSVIPVKVSYGLTTIMNPSYLNSLGSTGVALNGGSSNILVTNVNYPQKGSSTGLTFSAWVFSNKNTNNFDAVINTYGALLTVTNNAVYLYPDTTSNIGTFLSANYPMRGNWNYIAGVWNYSTRRGYLYIDGALVANSIGKSASLNAISRISLGYYNNNYFNGSISNVQLFNTALNATNVYQLYSNTPPPSASTVVSVGAIP